MKKDASKEEKQQRQAAKAAHDAAGWIYLIPAKESGTGLGKGRMVKRPEIGA